MARCILCGAEIAENMMVCKKCAETDKRGIKDYPCEECEKIRSTDCWKKCSSYKKWFKAAWHKTTIDIAKRACMNDDF